MPAQAGIQGAGGDGYQAFAGMTEALCRFVVQRVAAYVISNERTRKIIFTFRVFRGCIFPLVAWLTRVQHAVP
jgi:hypothetical protein